MPCNWRMKPKSPLKDITLIQLFDRFDTDAKARQHLEAVLWPDGPVCPHCKNHKDKAIYKLQPRKDSKSAVREGVYKCGACLKQFTVTVGTIFEDSHIPLRKWLIAWYLLCSSKKGISSLQLKRILEIGSYGTALFMTHRIRHALRITGHFLPSRDSKTVSCLLLYLPLLRWHTSSPAFNGFSI